MSNQYENFLTDLCVLLREKALEAKAEKTADPSGFNLGKLMGYYEVVSLVRNQIMSFDLDMEAFGLSDVIPDRDLL
ncbi:MAG: hypothetical protein ACK493_15225 [Planctomycetota bacterium]|jgi:hypothetical protein